MTGPEDKADGKGSSSGIKRTSDSLSSDEGSEASQAKKLKLQKEIPDLSYKDNKKLIWVQLEGSIETEACYVESNDKQPLQLFSKVFCQWFGMTKDKGFKFFKYDDRFNEVTQDTPIKDLVNTNINPLVIRYRLSEDLVEVKLMPFDSTFYLDHDTGIWFFVNREVEKILESKLKGKNLKYRILHDPEEKTWEFDEIQFNKFVEKSVVVVENNIGIRTITLHLELTESKEYSFWKLEEALIALKIPRIEDVEKFQCNLENVNIGERQLKFFKEDLKRKLGIIKRFGAPESICRVIIDAFLFIAVDCVNKDLNKDIKIALENWLNGTKAFGPIDYTCFLKNSFILVTEAKKDMILDGVGQNLMQISSALEDLAEKSNENTEAPMFGIVSTATEWCFLKWSGGLKKPKVERFECSCDLYTTDTEFKKEQKILRYLVAVLKEQANRII